MASAAESSAKMADIAKQRVAALDKLADTQRMAANNMVMSMDLSTLDPVSRQYFELQKRKILRQAIEAETEHDQAAEEPDDTTVSAAAIVSDSPCRIESETLDIVYE
jgi:No apical meristem-associated C-terminal domain